MTVPPQDEQDPTTQECRVEVSHEGRVVAAAQVTSSTEPHGTAKVSLRNRHDEVPPDAHGALVDKVLDHPGVSNSDNVHVVVPLGDAGTLTRLQERTNNFSARAAGASSVVDAEVAHPDPEEQ